MQRLISKSCRHEGEDKQAGEDGKALKDMVYFKTAHGGWTIAMNQRYKTRNMKSEFLQSLTQEELVRLIE